MSADLSSSAQGLVDQLLTLGRLQRTGILTVQGSEEIIGISVSEGEIVSADALNQTLEEGLGELLVQQGLIDSETYSGLVAEFDAGGGKVSDLLVERGYVDRQGLQETLRELSYRLCRRALSWETSTSKFYPGKDVAQEEGLRALSVDEVLVRAAEDLGDAGPLRGGIPSLDTIHVKTGQEILSSGQDELLLGLAFESGGGASRLLDHLDGVKTLAELASELSLSEFEARLAMYVLERSGQVRHVDTRTDLPFAIGRRRWKAGGKTSAADESPGPGLQAVLRRLRVELERVLLDWQVWPSRILAVVMLLLVTVAVVTDPSRVLLPFPWQEGPRQVVLDEQTSAAYLRIDRAAKTAFLVDGHFPETLVRLVVDDYLSADDLFDPAGRRLGYSAQVASYLIYPLDEGEPAPGASRTETVTGNFLLDPEFVTPELLQAPPLVLLD